MSEIPTQVACLTPSGTGAIAVLAVRGPRAWDIVRELFRPASGRPLPLTPGEIGGVWFGHLGHGDVADEVVLAVKDLQPAPLLELHCHGGRQVVDWLKELFCDRGAVACPWTELAPADERPLRAAAWRELARARTARTAAILLDQVNGALDAGLDEIRRTCQAGDRKGALTLVDELLRLAPLGLHLTAPWRVAVAGPPNVGKSSLVNALAGYQRSVVAPLAGTTRDVVSVELAIDGWPVELIDTAGLRGEAAGLEREGIERAREALKTADLMLWLHDASVPGAIDPDPSSRAAAAKTFSVGNKGDLPSAKPVAAGELRVSARTGAGIPDLCAAISRELVPDPPASGAAVPFLALQVEALTRSKAALCTGDVVGAVNVFNWRKA